METHTGSRSKRRRLRVLPGGKPETGTSRIASETRSGIVCCYGVLVRSISIEGVEVDEFEFLPDAA